MSSFQTKCLESLRLFEKPYKEVHRSLDEFMGSQEYGMRHRKLRRHLEGIRQVIDLFGEEAGKVARQHIISDLKEEGWTEDAPFPRDQEDYVAIGLL